MAVPAHQLKKETDGKFVLSRATKDALKAMPKFEYAENNKAELRIPLSNRGQHEKAP